MPPDETRTYLRFTVKSAVGIGLASEGTDPKDVFPVEQPKEAKKK